MMYKFLSPKFTNLVFITNKENKKPKQKLDDVDHIRSQSPQLHFLFVRYIYIYIYFFFKVKFHKMISTYKYKYKYKYIYIYI